MKVRKIGSVVLLLFLTSSVQAIDVSVNSSCGDLREPMVSLNSTSGGHVAEPGYYSQNKVCVRGVNYFEIRGNCQQDEQTVFTMQDLNNSHLSIHQNEYNYELCAPQVASSVKNSCSRNETKVLSVDSDNNTHAAAPGYTDAAYDKSLCMKNERPENVTLQLSGLSSPVYVDGNQLNTGQSLTPPLDYPYIVSDQPTGIVSYSRFLKLSRPSSDTVSMVQEAPSSFLLPFTSGGHAEIEDERSEVVSRDFLDLSPNFGFAEIDEPVVRVMYRSPHRVNGFGDRLSTGRNRITLSNKGLEGDELLIDISEQ